MDSVELLKCVMIKIPLFLGWSSVMRLAAIDCAQDENVATCRDYEIMGYPSLKFFPPKAAKDELGILRESYNKEIPPMMMDMTKYMEKIATNNSLKTFWKESGWPDFSQLRYTFPSYLSKRSTKNIIQYQNFAGPIFQANKAEREQDANPRRAQPATALG